MKKQALICCLLCLPLFAYAQESSVTPTYFNVLYRGVENPLKILAEGYSCDSLYVISTMKFRHTFGCNYYVTPMNESYGIFTVNAFREGDTVFIGKHEFRLLTTPDPVASVPRSRDGRIPKNALLAERGIRAQLDDFIYEVDFKIKSFTALIEEGDSLIYKEDITGEIFTSTLRSHFLELRIGDRIVFEKIIAVGPDKLERKLSPLSLTIR